MQSPISLLIRTVLFPILKSLHLQELLDPHHTGLSRLNIMVTGQHELAENEKPPRDFTVPLEKMESENEVSNVSNESSVS